VSVSESVEHWCERKGRDKEGRVVVDEASHDGRRRYVTADEASDEEYTS